MKRPRIRPTVVIPDAAPLIHLAAADALTILTAMGRVVVPDIVQLEGPISRTSRMREKSPPGLLGGEGVAATVAVATTCNLLTMAEQEGIIPDAQAVRERIVTAIPTANRVSNVPFINPITPR